MDGGSLYCGADDGNQCCDGNAPFAAKLIADGAREGHRKNRADKDDGDVESGCGGRQAKVLRERRENLQAILRARDVLVAGKNDHVFEKELGISALAIMEES